MPVFTFASRMPASVEELSAWHLRPGAFARLAPPWEDIRLLSDEGPPRDGSRLVFEIGRGPFALRWEAVHRDVTPGERFVDEQRSGPFVRWVHEHRFRPEEAATAASRLEEHIEYDLPGGWLGRGLGGPGVRRSLARLFAWRHARTARDLARLAAFRERPRLRVAIGGASGLIGRQLGAFLTAGGHEVVALVRDGRQPGILWRPQRGEIDAVALEGFDAVVHLGGENIAGGAWTAQRKDLLRRSRIDSTALLAGAVARLTRRPSVFICASATGFYGSRGDEELTESSAPGNGFLPDLCRDWEAAAGPAAEAGVRVVHLRTGVVLSPRGGALAKLLTPFRLGLGGRVGSGRQYMSWIGLDDMVGLIHFALMRDDLAGPVNATAPQPVTNAGFTRSLARVLRRPAMLPVPSVAIRTILGEMGERLLLEGCRVLPARLTEAGFAFLDPQLESALRFELGLAG